MSPPEQGPDSEPVDATVRLQARADGAPPLSLPGFGAPTYQPGDLLAGRYRVTRWIGRGGMGDVYEADDVELHERLALKVLRPDIANEPDMLERFRREIHLARKVTHPNVCRIFDLEHHQQASGQDVLFLTMELLAGETLRERLQRAGAMNLEEARPIVEQAAAALAAAHQAGIVHRDLKSANVMLVAAPEGTTRAVVTDFGLARASAGETLATLTRLEQIVGTPAYMAPEQVEGGEVTAAADLYALGVVMYEMATGELPFSGDSALSTALKRLQQPAPSPRALAPRLDPLWERAIVRCLERDPADRYASAADVARALRGEATGGRRGRVARRRRSALAAAVAALALAVAIPLYVARRRPPPAALAAIPGRLSVAVLGFKNNSGVAEASWLSGALAEMLRTELAAGESLRLVPAESIARTKVELGLGEPESLAGDTLARVRANLGSDYVLLGSYTALGRSAGGQIRLDLRLQDTAAGETRNAALVGTENELFDLVTRAGAALRGHLGVRPLSGDAAGEARASLPATAEGARFYAEGLSRLRLDDAGAARDLLERAVAADPRYPLAHAALSSAWSALGYDAKAVSEAELALELAGGLSREERLLVEGAHREAGRKWDQAADIYRTLWGFFPDNPHYGLRLAEAQTAAGKAKEALATVAELRRLPPPAGDDPRIDLAEAGAAGALADAALQRQAAERALAKGEALGARLLVARAHLARGRALRQAGDAAGALAAMVAAREAFAAAGDEAGVAQAHNERAILLFGQGKLVEAERAYAEVLAVARRIGDRRTAARALNNMAMVYGSQGNLAAARRTYEEILPIFREVGSKMGEASVLGNLGSVQQLRGDLEPAAAALGEAARIFRDIGQRTGEASALAGLGGLEIARGRLDEGERAFAQSRAICAEIANQSCLAAAIAGLGDVLTARDDLAGARHRHEEALAMRQKLAEGGEVADSGASLALIALAEGRAADAESLARAAAADLGRERATDDQAVVLALVAEALRAAGKTQEALGTAREAAALVEKSENLGARLQVSIAVARARAAGGESGPALAELAATAASAAQAGMVKIELEARLAQGRCELAAGRAGGGPRLQRLAADASARGFRLIARQAAAAARGSG